MIIQGISTKAANPLEGPKKIQAHEAAQNRRRINKNLLDLPQRIPVWLLMLIVNLKIRLLELNRPCNLKSDVQKPRSRALSRPDPYGSSLGGLLNLHDVGIVVDTGREFLFHAHAA